MQPGEHVPAEQTQPHLINGLPLRPLPLHKPCALCAQDERAPSLGPMLGPLSGPGGETCYVHRLCALWSPEVISSLCACCQKFETFPIKT
eukprot:1158685-Pelagomonas_calceolata.AAC.3